MRKISRPELEAINSYLSHRQVELLISGVSSRKRRAANRKLAKSVNRAFRKQGVVVSLTFP